MTVKMADAPMQARSREKNIYTVLAMAAWIVPLAISIWWGGDIDEFLGSVFFVFPMTIPFFVLSIVSVFGYDRLMWLAFLPVITSTPLLIYVFLTAP